MLVSCNNTHQGGATYRQTNMRLRSDLGDASHVTCAWVHNFGHYGSKVRCLQKQAKMSKQPHRVVSSKLLLMKPLLMNKFHFLDVYC